MTDLQPQLGTCACSRTPHAIHSHLLNQERWCVNWQPLPQATPAPPENPRTWVDKTPAYVEGELCPTCGSVDHHRRCMYHHYPPIARHIANGVSCVPCGDKWHDRNWRVSVGAQPGSEERHQAEDAYTISAFDYERDPVGSRDWELFWKGWQARSRTGSSPERAAHPESRGAALISAVRELYYSAKWIADRPVDERKLWEAVRDAAGFDKGQSPAAVCTHDRTDENGICRSCGEDCRRAAHPSSPGAPQTENSGDVFDQIGRKLMQNIVDVATIYDRMKEPFRAGGISALEELYFRMSNGKHFDWEELKLLSSPGADTEQKNG